MNAFPKHKKSNAKSTFNFKIESNGLHATPALTSYISIYLNLAYICQVSPFRISKDSNTKTTIIQRSYIQTTTCAAFTLLGLLNVFDSFVIKWRNLTQTSEESQSPTTYFSFLTTVFSALHKLSLGKALWCNQKAILDVIWFIKTNGGYNLMQQKGVSLFDVTCLRILPVSYFNLISDSRLDCRITVFSTFCWGYITRLFSALCNALVFM